MSKANHVSLQEQLTEPQWQVSYYTLSGTLALALVIPRNRMHKNRLQVNISFRESGFPPVPVGNPASLLCVSKSISPLLPYHSHSHVYVFNSVGVTIRKSQQDKNVSVQISTAPTLQKKKTT